MENNLFLGLTFQQFADINTLGICLLLLCVIIYILVFIFKNKISQIVKNTIILRILNTFCFEIQYIYLTRVLFLILLVGVVGANVYEFVFKDYPCMLCWYQRVLIYPMLILAITELFINTKVVYKFISVFAVLNFILASYHYYFHYMKYVADNVLSMPCSDNSILSDCGKAGVISFDFVTMPLLSAIMSLCVLGILWIMSQILKNKK